MFFATKRVRAFVADSLLIIIWLMIVATSVACFSRGLAKPAPQPATTTTTASGSSNATVVNYHNWSGYAAAGQNFSDVRAAAVMPQVDCTEPGAEVLIWVGFDGLHGGTVEQTGIGVKCSNTAQPTANYFAWWEMYPENYMQTMPLVVAPGDTVSLDASYAGTTFSFNVTNERTHTSSLAAAACAANLTCARSSAEWIFERPTVSGAYTPLADWGNSSLYNAAAATSGAPQPISAYAYFPIAMLDQANLPQATAGQLRNGGTAFTDEWLVAQ